MLHTFFCNKHHSWGRDGHNIEMGIAYKIIDFKPSQAEGEIGILTLHELNCPDNQLEVVLLKSVGSNKVTPYLRYTDSILIFDKDINPTNDIIIGDTLYLEGAIPPIINYKKKQ